METQKNNPRYNWGTIRLLSEDQIVICEKIKKLLSGQQYSKSIDIIETVKEHIADLAIVV